MVVEGAIVRKPEAVGKFTLELRGNDEAREFTFGRFVADKSGLGAASSSLFEGCDRVDCGVPILALSGIGLEPEVC